MKLDPRRIRLLNKSEDRSSGPVLYWMGRDQRTQDNWALIFAQRDALEKKVPLVVVFTLVESFLEAPLRHYDFMLRGLSEVSQNLRSKNIPFFIEKGDPSTIIHKFIKDFGASALFSDFEPLKIRNKWKADIIKKIKIPFYEVDARNIVPCWIASDKKEFSAGTFRRKISRHLEEFLHNCPALKKHPYSFPKKETKLDWSRVMTKLKIDETVKAVKWLKPGESGAKKALNNFIKYKLESYPENRNDPTLDGQSNLSPYLHFGQISSLKVALEVMASGVSKRSKEVFLEELIVRRELSDNFCFYSKNYDLFKGAHEWAQKTLNQHRKDKRRYNYTLKQLEDAKTHDDAWNAAQLEMVKTGKMHGYMRMYWAKKILEWTGTPETALKYAIYLNNKYELDGRDTNGYAGIMWSICGIHDRAWGERDVFGKIRYMSYNGLKSKFKLEKYIEKVNYL